VQTITVDDNEPPQILCPPNVTYECDEIGDFGTATATDNCDPDPSITFEDDTTFYRCPCEYVVLRTWTATDECGNSSSCQQMIRIEDTTLPEFTLCPRDTTVGCEDGIGDLPHATAVDNCNPEPDVSYEVFTIPGDCPFERRIVRAWEVTDGCCNTVMCMQTVTVRDQSPPVLTAAPGGRVGCNETPVFTGPGVTDNCDLEPTVEVISTTIESGPEACEETHTRGWIATDACGNVSEPVYQSIVTTVDTIGPVLTCAPSKSVPYGSSIIFDDPLITDNCSEGGEPETLSTFVDPGGPGELETYTRCWVAYDPCGNASEPCCQTITVEAPPPPYCTFGCWDWGAACLGGDNYDISTQPACIRDEYFYEVFPEGVTVGDAGGYTARWTSPEAVEEFGCGYGIPWVLRRDYVDPGHNELGVLAGQLLALRLNREFSCGGYLSGLGFPSPEGCYGDFVIPDSVGTSKFAGLTVDEFLALADEAISGNTSVLRPYGANIDHLWVAATYLNWLFSDCGGQRTRPAQPPLVYQPESDDDETPDPLPERLELTLRPNPLRTSTVVSLALPASGDVSVEVYDVQGRKIATVMQGSMSAGNHTATWGGTDDSGSHVGTGIYFCRVTVNGQVSIMAKLIKL
jgi:hypothetical protein